MPAKRPVLISTLGILNIVFGSLGLLTNVCCAPAGLFVSSAMSNVQLPQQAGQPAPTMPTNELNKIPEYFAFQCASIVVSALTGGLLLASGIGFLKMKQWGRAAGICYAIIGIVWGVIAWIVTQKYIFPAVETMMQNMGKQAGPNNPFVNTQGIMRLMMTFGLVFNFVYPTAVLIVMLLPAVKRGLEGKIDPSWEPDPSALPMDDSADGGLEP